MFTMTVEFQLGMKDRGLRTEKRSTDQMSLEVGAKYRKWRSESG